MRTFNAALWMLAMDIQAALAASETALMFALRATARANSSTLSASRAASRRVALTPLGEQRDSLELAQWLRQHLEQYGHMALLIGGPLGFAPEVLTACHEQLALSRLTLPHELARVVLLEQLYRVMTLLNGEKYHK